MENYKDVIVSQPPAMYSKSAYTANISLENYKGILLCDRPGQLFGGTMSATGSGGLDGGKTFCPANRTGNPVGLGPTVESRAVREQNQALRVVNQKRNRNQSLQVLSKHRKWLHSFAKQMQSMKQADIDREVEAAHRAARMQEMERKRRMEVQQEIRHQQVQELLLQQQLQQQQQQQQQEQQQQQQYMSPTPPAAPRDSSASKKSNNNKSKKPKWAMTEDEALDDELAMNDDLLDFASKLDYDRFVSDYEVAEALNVMRDRVQEIAKANNWTAEDLKNAAEQDEADDDLQSAVAPSDCLPSITAPRPGSAAAAAAAASSRSPLPAGYAEHDKGWDASTGKGRVLKRAISKDAMSLAERLLASSPSMQKVYSKQSLARVLQKCALQGDVNISESMLLALPGAQQKRTNDLAHMPADALAAATAIGPEIQEPLVVQVSPDAAPVEGQAEGQSRVLLDMQRSRERTQGLPYLYRCPAI